MTLHKDTIGQLVAAAGAVVASTAFGSVVAARENVHGEPIGVGLPISVPAGLVAGWGSGLSAPWPMSALALMSATWPRKSSGRVCALIGAGVIVGTLIEPVTWQHTSPLARIAVLCNLFAGGALLREGVRAQSRLDESSPVYC